MPGFLKTLVVIAGFAVGAAAVALPYLDQIGKVQKKAEVRIGQQYITADVAKDEPTREKGLGGRADLGINDGLLFIFPQAGNYGFWMKGMLIPIDLVWIAGGKIVGFEENMQPPAPGTPDADLKVYYPPQSVDRVLELRAGRVRLLQANIGDPVYVRTLIPTSRILQNPR